jgi:hypothetical protein
VSRRIPIAVGQRFREVRLGYLGRPSPPWIVDELVVHDVDARFYARLVCVADGSLRKTLSLAALGDRSRFAPVDEQP